MKRIEDALLSTDCDEIRLEVADRFKLVNEMMGSLYTGIVMDEIERLQARLAEVAYENKP